jgi:hypothetical protein
MLLIYISIAIKYKKRVHDMTIHCDTQSSTECEYILLITALDDGYTRKSPNHETQGQHFNEQIDFIDIQIYQLFTGSVQLFRETEKFS